MGECERTLKSPTDKKGNRMVEQKVNITKKDKTHRKEVNKKFQRATNSSLKTKQNKNKKVNMQ